MDTGEVISIVGDQVVVKSDPKPPKIGSLVFSSKGKAGIVMDIIGPVDKPYLVVKPNPNVKVKIGDRLRSNLSGG